MTYSTESEKPMLAYVKEAYAQASNEALKQGDELPSWNELPYGFPQAFITVFTAGGRYWIDDFERLSIGHK